MHKTFTQEDLLRYIYGEMNLEEQEEIYSSILYDDKLKADFLVFKEAQEFLSKTQLIPSSYVVDNIISYAKALVVTSSKNLKTIDFVLN